MLSPTNGNLQTKRIVHIPKRHLQITGALTKPAISYPPSPSAASGGSLLIQTSTFLASTIKKHLPQQVPSSNGQRQPIIFALRARFLGRFRIRPVAQSLSLLGRSVNWQLSILPGRLHPSTFDVQVLNYCVRNGNRWNHLAIVTRYFVEICYLKTKQKKFMNQTFHDSSGQRQPINFALRAHFLGRFRIRLVTQSLTLLDKSVIR